MEPTPIVEMRDLVIATAGRQKACGAERLAIMGGDVIGIDGDLPFDRMKLLRTLATLAPPDQGRYRFNGMGVDLNNYRQCLAVKRQIGYLAADAAMISNRTIRENLLLTRFYYENDLSIDIDATVAALCESAGLTEYLNRRPAELNEAALKRFFAIREMGKKPCLVLIDRPENFMETGPDDAIFVHLKNMVRSTVAIVFFSHHPDMNGFARKQITVDGDTIQIRDIRVERTASG